MCDGFACAFHELEFLRFASEFLQMLKVARLHGSDVFAAEDADLELLILSWGKLGTRRFQVVERLKDDLDGANVLGDRPFVAMVRNQFRRRGQVDAIDMSMPSPLLAGFSK